MSFVSTNNKSGMGGLTTTTPPITGESGGVTADSVAGSVADAAEAAVEQAGIAVWRIAGAIRTGESRGSSGAGCRRRRYGAGCGIGHRLCCCRRAGGA